MDLAECRHDAAWIAGSAFAASADPGAVILLQVRIVNAPSCWVRSMTDRWLKTGSPAIDRPSSDTQV
jgi:hypothetical protein